MKMDGETDQSELSSLWTTWFWLSNWG